MNLGCHMAQMCCPSVSALVFLSPKQKGSADHKDAVLPFGRTHLQGCICRELVCNRVSSKDVSARHEHSSPCSAPKSQGRTQASLILLCHSLLKFVQTPKHPSQPQWLYLEGRKEHLSEPLSH